MFVIRKVADMLGCELHEIEKKVAEAQSDPSIYCNLCIAALHYGSGKTDDDMTETEKSITSMEQLKSVGVEFAKAYAAFFGLKGDPEGE